MARPYSVSPVLRPGRSFYVATFRTSSGARTTRGLGTGDKDAAEAVCAGLVWLWRHRPATEADVPRSIVADKAVDLFFESGDEEDDGFSGAAAPLAAELDGRRDEVRDLRRSVAVLQDALAAEKAAREALERSVLGRAAAAGARCPTMTAAMELFEKHIHAATSTPNAKQVLASVRRFLATLPVERAKPVDVLAADLAGYLDEYVSKGAEDKRQARRDAMRRRIGRFLNWCAATWEYPSQMDTVPAVGKLAVARERGDIHWHAEDEVEAALATIPERLKAALPESKQKHVRAETIYWRALIGTLAYAGLNLAELAWLRRQDLETWTEKGKPRARIWITAVTDPENPAVRHLLKTEHRRRGVNVHPRRLWPRLKAFLDAKLAGEHFLFPMPAGRRRPKRQTPGAAERWPARSLEVILRGHVGGRETVRKATPGLLPEGMTPRSLRRTFGSLRLRDGLTTAEVAAEMGNTEEVVRSHYARLLSAEVSIY